MNEQMKDVTFITIPKNRKIGSLTLKDNIPLPILFSKGQKPEDIDFNSIVAGLIKVAAWDDGNVNFPYYRDILLQLQPNTVEELNIAAIAKSNKKEYDFALELMLAVNHISQVPESYVNLAVLYAQMAVDLHKQRKDVEADMYDDRILSVLEECISRHPSYSGAYSEISAFHMRHGDIERSKEFLDRYISLEKDEKKKKVALETLKKMENAINSKDKIMYAYDKIMMGMADEAIKELNKYIAKNDKSWEAYFL
ncbi:MAG: hypothetical protein HUK24_02240, partial [Sphaerochaetaceae bacterium]|nr:hypothetical protein [Sphaerochaetaceae bacterium]